MHIIVCLDDRNGMLFHKRRLSSDRALCARILEQSAGNRLWMNGYSAKLFDQASVCVAEDFLDRAAPGEFCFVEDADITAWEDSIESITVYRWNRTYPSDKKFPVEYFSDRWTLRETVDFPGNSHETITQQRYAL